MTLYHILIDFGGGLDLKGKISASLAIRKMIERLSNEYESRVRSVQDTKCEIDLSSPADDLTASLRSMLEGMAGGMTCRIEIESAAGSAEAPSVSAKAPASPARPTPHGSKEAAAPSRSQRSGTLAEILDLVGAEEFKALCEELNDMAPALRALKDQSYLQRNTYLFTIDDGLS